MTKILVCSDLHTNFHRDRGWSAIKSLQTEDVDVVVIAGDLTTLMHIEESLGWFCDRYPEVVYVTGNHEYYQAGPMDFFDKLVSDFSKERSNLHFLNGSREVISGVGFIGGTLWFPDTPDAKLQKALINDFRFIDKCDPKAFELHDDLVDYLMKNIQKGDVVVTHHLPSYRSVSPQFVGSSLNCYFASDLDYLVEYTKPAVWIHGHTHTPCDYMLGDTRVCANPLGYPRENSLFNEAFILEV